MSNIITPKTVINKGQEVWASKKLKKGNTQPTKMERTGDKTFNVHHEDGSIFECQINNPNIRFKKDSLGDAGGGSRFFIGDDIKVGNVMSNADRRRLGLEEDPDLSK